MVGNRKFGDDLKESSMTEEEDKKVYLLHFRKSSVPPSVEYVSIQHEENEDGLRPLDFGSLGQSAPCSKTFPATRARVVMLVLMFCYQLNGLSMGPLQTQYLHFRFLPEYFNDTNSSLSSSVSSNCDSNSSSLLAQQESALQERVAEYQMYLSIANLIPMIPSIVILGSWSDLLGRRQLFLLPCITALIKQIFSLAIIKLDLPVWLFLVPNIADGFAGSFCTIFLASFAYTADLTPSEKSRTFGIVLATFSLSMANVGALLAVGYLLQYLGFFYGSLIPMMFVTCSILIGVFCLPETISAQRRKEARQQGYGNPLKYLKNVFGFYLSEGTVQDRIRFCLLLLIALLNFITAYGHLGVITLYQLNLPFCWDPDQIGWYGAAGEGFKAIMSIVAVHILQKCFPDTVLVALSLLSAVGQLMLEGLARTDLILYIALLAGFFSSASIPVNRSLLSKLAAADKQGALFASIAVMETIGTLLSSTVYNSVYEATVSTVPGAVFFIMAGILGLDLILLLIFMKISRIGKLTQERIIQPSISIQTIS